MGIIDRMRKQNAIYWPLAGPDDFGCAGYGPLVELISVGGVNYRVRWEERADEFVNPLGATVVSAAVVYVPALPGGGEVCVGGFLWLGDRAALVDEAVPTNNPGAAAIQRVDMLPNLRVTEYLRTVYL